MAINRSLWATAFQKFPRWLCPTCHRGHLEFGYDSLKHEETGLSERAHGEDGWDPDWIDKRFSALLKCQDPGCGELVAVCGKSSVNEVHLEDEFGYRSEYYDHFEPTHFFPPLCIIPIPSECPDVVKRNLEMAFGHYWLDKGACANRLRAAVEALLNAQAVPRTTINKKRKRVLISTHDRVLKYKAKNKDAADLLLAIKWIGNEGSHAGTEELSDDDLLNGFELFEEVLELVYVKNNQRLKRLAKDIAKRKGKPKKPKKWKKKKAVTASVG